MTALALGPIPIRLAMKKLGQKCVPPNFNQLCVCRTVPLIPTRNTAESTSLTRVLTLLASVLVGAKASVKALIFLFASLFTVMLLKCCAQLLLRMAILEKLSKTLRSWEGVMAVSWSNLWEIFTPHGCRVCGPVTQFFWVGPSLQNPEKTMDKFAGLLNFWVGRSLQNPEKTAEKSKFQEILDKPVLQNPEKQWKKPHFENFWVPLKIAGNSRKSKF